MGADSRGDRAERRAGGGGRGWSWAKLGNRQGRREPLGQSPLSRCGSLCPCSMTTFVVVADGRTCQGNTRLFRGPGSILTPVAHHLQPA